MANLWQTGGVGGGVGGWGVGGGLARAAPAVCGVVWLAVWLVRRRSPGRACAVEAVRGTERGKEAKGEQAGGWAPRHHFHPSEVIFFSRSRLFSITLTPHTHTHTHTHSLTHSHQAPPPPARMHSASLPPGGSCKKERGVDQPGSTPTPWFVPLPELPPLARPLPPSPPPPLLSSSSLPFFTQPPRRPPCPCWAPGCRTSGGPPWRAARRPRPRRRRPGPTRTGQTAPGRRLHTPSPGPGGRPSA